MKYIIQINQVACIELGIRNINRAFIFDFLTTASSWADPIIVDNEVFYWVSRSVIAKELVMLNIKEDTIYRHLKALDKLGVIKYRKSGKKDIIQITEKAKSYLFFKYDIKSPKGDNGEKKRKLKDKRVKNKINVERIAREFGIDVESIRDFIAYRKEIGHKVKRESPVRAFAKELRAIKSAGIEPNRAIEVMKEREWKTLKLDWVQLQIDGLNSSIFQNMNRKSYNSNSNFSGKVDIVEENLKTAQEAIELYESGGGIFAI